MPPSGNGRYAGGSRGAGNGGGNYRSNGGGRANHPMYRDRKDKMQIAGFDAMDSPMEDDRPNYHAMDMQQLQRRRDDDMDAQDVMLDQIHNGVKGLKNHAHAINGEVVEQNAMIDDIGTVRICFGLLKSRRETIGLMMIMINKITENGWRATRSGARRRARA